jgi:aminoglycoside 6'-N-acetyltransferase
MPSRAYEFCPQTAVALALVGRWLAVPHVARWWGAPSEQFAIIKGDLAEPSMDQHLITPAGRPFGYLQSDDVSAGPQSGLERQPRGSRGIDPFIGEPDMIGRGHGSACIRAFVDRLFAAGCQRVLTDPDPANGRAIRAYHKAGFASRREVDTADGCALLMIRDSNRAIAA